jgi:hypothetical protein
LHPEATQQLMKKGFLDFQGNFDFSEIQLSKERGRHLVMSMEILVEGHVEDTVLVFLKIFPDLPLVDIGATELATLLVGPQLPWVELVKIHSGKKSYPAIFCEGIRGQIITGNNFGPERKLDPEAYSKRVMVGLFLNQEDGKDSNFIVKNIHVKENFTADSETPPKISETESETVSISNPDGPSVSYFELVSVDNDRSFYPSLLKQGTGKIFPQVKDISLLFDEMNEKISSAVCDSFLMLEPYHVLENWLKILKKYENSMKMLFTEQEQEKFFPKQLSYSFSGFSRFVSNVAVTEESLLKFFLPKNTMDVLFWKFLKIRNRLLSVPESTHLEILKEVEPYLSNFYEKLLSIPATPAERFQEGFGRFYGVSSKTVPEQTILSGYHTLVTKHGSAVSEEEMKNCMDIKFHEQALLIVAEKKKQIHKLVSKLEKSKNLDYLDLVTELKEVKELSPSSLQELMLNLNFLEIPHVIQSAIFQILEKLKVFCQIICFKNSKFLDLGLLLRILKHQKALHTLILINCPKLALPELLEEISKLLPNLVEIRLERFKIRYLPFPRGSVWNFSNEQPNLAQVVLKKCNISKIDANAPNLSRLVMLDCHGLMLLNIWTDMQQIKWNERLTKEKYVFFDAEFVFSRLHRPWRTLHSSFILPNKLSLQLAGMQ